MWVELLRMKKWVGFLTIIIIIIVMILMIIMIIMMMAVKCFSLTYSSDTSDIRWDLGRMFLNGVHNSGGRRESRPIEGAASGQA